MCGISNSKKHSESSEGKSISKLSRRGHVRAHAWMPVCKGIAVCGRECICVLGSAFFGGMVCACVHAPVQPCLLWPDFHAGRGSATRESGVSSKSCVDIHQDIWKLVPEHLSVPHLLKAAATSRVFQEALGERERVAINRCLAAAEA